MENPKQVINVKLNVNPKTKEVSFLTNKYDRHTLCVQHVETMFQHGQIISRRRTGFINLDKNAETATAQLRAILQNPEYLDDMKMLIAAQQAGKPILINNELIGGHIFQQEYAVGLRPLEKGKPKEFLKRIADAIEQHSGQGAFDIYFTRPLLRGLRLATGSAYERTLELFDNPDTAQFEFKKVLTLDSKLQSAYATELNKIFFESKSTRLKRASAEGEFLLADENYIFWCSFFDNNPAHLATYKDMLVPHTNSVALRKSNRKLRAEQLAMETDEEQTSDATVTADLAQEEETE
jgi:hypothetical protein